MPDPVAIPKVSLTDLFKTTMSIMAAVEQIFPSGKGKDKFDSVYGQVMAYAPLVNVALPVLEQVVPIFINSTVDLFNRIGRFKKPAPPGSQSILDAAQNH
jgi:hypothetical protein